MADIIYIDAEDGMKRVMNNAKLYTRLLGKFKTDTNLADLVAFVAAENWEKAQGAAHTIKGIAANLSLLELFKKSLEVESQIKEKALNPAVLESLKTCYAETLTQIDKVIAQYAA